MAEVTGFRNNALPYPVYGVPWAVVYPMLDADGDLVTGATTPDAEVSKNGDTFADCTNESTEIATNSGVYYLLLTATEMTADIVTVIAKSATAGMKTTVITLYPRKMVTLRSGTVAANAADGTTLQLDSGAVAIDDYYNGCLLVGTIDAVVEARMISDYVGSTKVCTVSPAYNTAPDNNDTFVLYMPDGRQVVQADSVGVLGGAHPAVTVTGVPKVDVAYLLGTAWLTPGTAGTPDVNTKLAGGTAWASGAITAAVYAADAITAAKLAADVGTEIAAAVWAAAARTLTANTNFNDLNAAGVRAALGLASANLDTQLAAIAGYIDTEVAAILAAVDTEVAAIVTAVNAIKLSTDNLPSDPADASVVAGLIAAAEAKIDTLLARLTGARAGYLDFLNGTVPSRIKKNTAFTKFSFKLDLAADGTPATGVSPTVQISKNGAAFGALTDPTVTELSDGWYWFDFAAADLNADTVAVKITAALCRQVDLLIVPQVAS